jgi:hypothetical protein
MFWLSRLEKKSQPLASHRVFLARVWRNFLASLAVVVFSLILGTAGYHYIGGVGWVDGLLNAAMILTGMGPVDKMESTAGKLFATFYALYSGIAFLTMIAVLVLPIYHRFLHHFHLSTEEDEQRLARHHR